MREPHRLSPASFSPGFIFLMHTPANPKRVAHRVVFRFFLVKEAIAPRSLPVRGYSVPAVQFTTGHFSAWACTVSKTDVHYGLHRVSRGKKSLCVFVKRKDDAICSSQCDFFFLLHRIFDCTRLHREDSSVWNRPFKGILRAVSSLSGYPPSPLRCIRTAASSSGLGTIRHCPLGVFTYFFTSTPV